ncbi:MAG TPA: enoyl-CoA hydratase-related protein [Candidatus Methylomirabilis sp.]|nr:enoyl-CoA hydratase-related protein [Candidatus Methylomirabilis sp.]
MPSPSLDPSGDALVALRIEDRGAAGRIARITFDNPAKRNALGLRGKEQLVDVVTSLRHDESLRAVVLTGAGEASFVAGTDLSEMADFDLAAAEASATKTHRACDAVRTFPVPVIARINGDCFGSGMELAACADLRVGADHARFGMPETRFGIPSGMEASVLPKLIGWGKAVELVLTGDHISAQEAHRIGYLQRLVPARELDAAVEQWLASLLACGPRALRLQKRLVIDWDRMSTTDAARAGIQAFADAYRTDEPRRLMLAFLEERRARRGRDAGS